MVDRVKEWLDQEDKIALKFGAMIASIVASDMRDAALKYLNTGRADLPEDHEQRIRAAFKLMIGESVRTMGDRMIDEFKFALADLENKEVGDEFFERVIQAYIEAYGAAKITRVSATTRSQIQSIIAAGSEAGESVSEIAKRIQENIPRISNLRGAVIARTETHSASQFASNEVAKTADIPLAKKWNSIEDTRVRDFNEPIADFDHRQMDGKVVPMDQPFRVPRSPRIGGGTESLMFPGDPNGSAANIINCRCVQTYERAAS